MTGKSDEKHSGFMWDGTLYWHGIKINKQRVYFICSLLSLTGATSFLPSLPGKDVVGNKKIKFS